MSTPHGSGQLWTRNFIYLTLSVFLVSTAFYFLMPTLPVYLQETMGADKRAVGLIIATYTLAALLVRPFAGYVLDTMGRKSVFLVTVIAFSALFLFYPFITFILPLLVLRFLHGLSWGASTTAGFTLVVDFVPLEKRGRGIGYFGLSFTVAMSAGPVFGLKVMGDNNFTALFIVASVVALAGVILAFLIRYPEFKRPVKTPFNPRMLIARKSLTVSINMLILTATYGGVLTFITIYANENDMSALTGWFFTVTAIGTALTRIFSGKLFDKYGPSLLSVFGIISVSAGLMILGQAPIASGFLLSGFVIGMGFGVVFPTFQTMANNVVHRERRGTANSTFLTGLDLGIGLGSVLTGALAERMGLDRTFRLSALLALAGLVYFLVFSLPHYTRNRVED